MQPLKMYKTSIGFLILKHQNLFSLSPFSSPFHFPPAKGIRTFYTCTLQFENFYSVLQSGTLLKSRSAVELIQKKLETTTYQKFSSSLPSYSSIKAAVAQELSGLLKKTKRVEWGGKKRREKKVHLGKITYGLKKASLRNSDRLLQENTSAPPTQLRVENHCYTWVKLKVPNLSA